MMPKIAQIGHMEQTAVCSSENQSFGDTNSTVAAKPAGLSIFGRQQMTMHDGLLCMYENCGCEDALELSCHFVAAQQQQSGRRCKHWWLPTVSINNA